jgi:Flp pilus assembly pilin Flp
MTHLTLPTHLRADLCDDEGSLVAEYGLLAVVAATVAGVLIAFATGGALQQFFGELLDHARGLVIR